MKFRRCLAPTPPLLGPPGMASPCRGPCPGGVVYELATDANPRRCDSPTVMTSPASMTPPAGIPSPSIARADSMTPLIRAA